MSSKMHWKARELEIIELLAQGFTNREVAARLHLSQETIRWYNKQIFGKLDARNRIQAVQRALDMGLLESIGKAAERKSVPRSPVQYVSNKGIDIACQVIGNGPVDLLFIHGFISHLELAWEDAEYAEFFDQLGKFARVILFDKRGTGLSDRMQGAPSLEDTLSDALCVLNAVSSNQTFVMGTSEGGAASILLASTYPERVRGLILYSSTPKLVKTNSEPKWADDEKQFDENIERIQKQWGGPWAIDNFAPSRAGNEAFRNWWAKVLRSSTSPSGVAAVLRNLRDVDIRSLLPQIHTRTLVIHKTNDRILPVEAGRYLAQHMPNTTWVELPGSDHFFFVDSGKVVSAVSEFIRERTSEPSIDTWIGIVLYMSLPGLHSIKKTIQDGLNTHHPRGIAFSGDETAATFDSPSRAIQSAITLRNLIGNDTVKICLHVGECDFENGMPTKPVMDTVRYAANYAPLGKILLTQTLRDILAGSGIIFDLQQIHVESARAKAGLFYALT